MRLVTFLRIPKKTTKWALRNFEDWREVRNRQFPNDKVPMDLLTSDNPTLLSKWLSRFVAETRNAKGDPYTPSTLNQLLASLLRHMRTANPNTPNFMDKKNTHFQGLHGTLDNVFRKLHENGIGRKVKHAEIITKDEENQLWESGELGTKTPRSLQNAVFYYNGKNFCLRGGEECRQLKVSQIRRMYKPDSYIYYEYVSKNRQGTFRQQHLSCKEVPIYACSRAGDRCHVRLLDLYLQNLPPEAIEKDIFYVRPLDKIPSDPSAPWYTSVPIGHYTLDKKVSVMCRNAGIMGHKTNHSLRATGATELYRSDVPEKIIQERTGHRSLKALRVYERSTDQQHEAVSSLLSSEKETTFHQQMTEIKQSHHIDARCQPLSGTSNFSFQNLSGCTINIIHQPEKPSTSGP